MPGTVVSFSISEDEFRGLPAKQLVGQLGCWTYFQSIKSEANKEFVKNFKSWLKTTTVPGIVKEGRVTCSPMVQLRRRLSLESRGRESGHL